MQTTRFIATVLDRTFAIKARDIDHARTVAIHRAVKDGARLGDAFTNTHVERASA